MKSSEKEKKERLALLREILAKAERSGITEAEGRRRERAAKAELAELDLAVRRKELMRTDEAGRLWGGMITAARNQLLSLPSKLAPWVASSSDAVECQEIIRKEIYEALTCLSKYEPQEKA